MAQADGTLWNTVVYTWQEHLDVRAMLDTENAIGHILITTRTTSFRSAPVDDVTFLEIVVKPNFTEIQTGSANWRWALRAWPARIPGKPNNGHMVVQQVLDQTVQHTDELETIIDDAISLFTH